ncbi:MAG: sigma-54 dependent transcriptional regulator [Flavobacteriales bacterium]|nr:sigma-54 dependent transcriptional regulator [Flavobacteriales bacterium]
MGDTLQATKNRYGIIGNYPALHRAIETAMQVGPADITVLIRGESGTGKEAMPKIIHGSSMRRHAKYIAVNCAAIPEGTIDSELFGHQKGAFTGAHESRKGYFEEADGGTIFLDEVGELPKPTQARLLRVLETGEYMRVGSSKVSKTDVRVVAASNLDFDTAIGRGRFREDLFYRLNQVPISMPPLRDRGPDIHLLFRKFTADFSDRHRMPPIRLDEDAVELLTHYPWPGNVRQLKNIAEHISVVETDRRVSADKLLDYLPEVNTQRLPMALGEGGEGGAEDSFSEREILYKLLFEMKSDLTDLKSLVLKMLSEGPFEVETQEGTELVKKVFGNETGGDLVQLPARRPSATDSVPSPDVHSPHEDVVEVSENLSLVDNERELIIRALEKHGNRRKLAAEDLGISERTLYRKINEYDIK